MKYAFMSFSAPERNARELFKLAADLGYEGVEPRVENRHGHGIELALSKSERQAVGRMAAGEGVEICCLATGLCFADPAANAGVIASARRYIELACDIGAPRLRVFGGVLPEHISREQAIDVVADSLRQLAPEAKSAGVTICLETHDAWCSPKHVAEVMRKVDHPAVAVNWDMMHPTRAARVPIPEAYQILLPWIEHVHIHDGFLGEPLRFARCGEGEFDMAEVFSQLVSDNYPGWISGEWIGCSEIIDLADELKRLRRLEEAAAAQARV